MPRDVDERKTRRVLNRLRRARADAEARGEDLSEWEIEFVQSVEGRLEQYGSAFNDPEKGDLAEPLSGRQRVKLNEVSKKAKGKDRKKPAFKTRKPLQAKKPMNRGKGARTYAPRVRDISEEIEADDDAPAAEADETPRPSGPPTLRVVTGGKDDD